MITYQLFYLFQEGHSHEVCTPVVTSIFDDHIVGTLPVIATPKSSSVGDAVNRRQRKREAHGAALEAEEDAKAEQPVRAIHILRQMSQS